MGAGGELLRWDLGRILPLALLASVMLGLLVGMSGTAQWVRRIPGPLMFADEGQPVFQLPAVWLVWISR